MKSLSRGRYFVQMLRQGLMQYPTRTSYKRSSTWSDGIPIPILIKHDDSNGCHPAKRSDKYGFPRLTWSIPANVIDQAEKVYPYSSTSSPSPSWCAAIGMPSYKMWRDLVHNENGMLGPHMNNSDIYPWNEKIRKAIWRGSTTCNKGMYGHLPFLDIPRSRVVQLSIERPDSINAGFHKLAGKYENITIDDKLGRMLKEAVPLREMMRYKGKSLCYFRTRIFKPIMD